MASHVPFWNQTVSEIKSFALSCILLVITLSIIFDACGIRLIVLKSQHSVVLAFFSKVINIVFCKICWPHYFFSLSQFEYFLYPLLPKAFHNTAGISSTPFAFLFFILFSAALISLSNSNGPLLHIYRVNKKMAPLTNIKYFSHL